MRNEQREREREKASRDETNEAYLTSSVYERLSLFDFVRKGKWNYLYNTCARSKRESMAKCVWLWFSENFRQPKRRQAKSEWERERERERKRERESSDKQQARLWQTVLKPLDEGRLLYLFWSTFFLPSHTQTLKQSKGEKKVNSTAMPQT